VPSANTRSSTDRFLGGRVTLVQPRDGHRAGLDAALLQAAVPAAASGLAIDLGTGAGAVAFSLAARAPSIEVVGIEIDPALVACAEVALQLDGNRDFRGRVRIIAVDAGDADALFQAVLAERSAAWVLMNPPYDTPGTVRPSPDLDRRRAHVAERGTLARWVRTAARALKPGGRLALIQRAAALPDVLAALGGGFGGVRVLPVHPAAAAPATRIVVLATRESREPLRLLAGVVLHAADGRWTEAADAILRGAAELPMGGER
jgi:tRNA1(Val) A37 N6-methylase TrmN6